MYDPSHPSFTAPTNPDISVWRYMDLPKLASMLHTNKLWFSRSDLLGDPHEGARGKFNQQTRMDFYGENYLSVNTRWNNLGKIARETTYVSCWHMAEIESVAMWRAYTTTGHGVAIRSTFHKLTAEVIDSRTFYAGEVRYLDPDSEWIDEGNAFSPFLCKRKSFEYEREVRLMCMGVPYPPTGPDPTYTSPAGYGFKANVGDLIDEVYIAPDHPQWFRETVQAVIEKFTPGVPVKQSDLDRSPMY